MSDTVELIRESYRLHEQEFQRGSIMLLLLLREFLQRL